MYMHVYLCACTYVCLLGLDTLLFIFATWGRGRFRLSTAILDFALLLLEVFLVISFCQRIYRRVDGWSVEDPVFV